MRILITGGAGLIGRHLTRRLTAAGHQAVVLSRSQRPPQDGVTHLRWDGLVIPTEAVGGVDGVVNLAGSPLVDHRWTPAYKKEILESRLSTTRACTAFIRQAGVPVFVSGSAVGYYGTDTRARVDESGPAGSDFLGRTCKLWEAAAADSGARTVITRMGVVMAADGGALPRLLKPFQYYAGGYLGDGGQGFPWVHVEDAAGALVWALTTPDVSGPLNVTAPDLKNNRQIAHLLGKILGRPSGLPVPAFVIKAVMGESSIVLLEGKFVEPRRLQTQGYVFRYPQAEAAFRDLLAALLPTPDARTS